MRLYLRYFALLLVCLLYFTLPVSSQEYQGITGLLLIPSADTDSAGTFRGMAMYLDKQSNPLKCNGEPYPTFCYGVALTPWEWVEASFIMTLVKEPKYGNYGPIGYYNQDRHFNIKLRPLKEGRWWPAIAIGWDDVGNFHIGKSITTNNNFENIYAVITKHLEVRGHKIGANIGYRYFPSKKDVWRRGIVAGITYTPWLGDKLRGPRAWLQRPRLIVEWDGNGINFGADVLLWRHLFVQACLVHGSGFTGGLSYHYTIPF